MKVLYTIIITVLLAQSVFSQNASTYFPSSPGYRWNFKNTPLDSLNNPQTSLATYQVDSFATVANYQGLLSSNVLTKSGLISLNQNTPFTDTIHYNFQSTNGYYYLNPLSFINSFPLLDSITLLNFLRAFQGWYSTYRFAQAVNSQYTIFTRDTTISTDTISLPLRFAATGKRLNDQTISTVNGNYLAKKFLITFTVSYGILPPILYIPIITRPDTTYIAEGVWKVKEVMPSVNVDLSQIGVALSFTIPGNITELASPTAGIYSHSDLTPTSAELYQNFPNPFNPKTEIRYSISNAEFVELTVYNSLGAVAESLVKGKQGAGEYTVVWDASNFPSGDYFCRLTAGGNTVVKKLVLIK